MQHAIRIGTRGSPLAMVQTRDVKARILAAHDHLTPDDVEIVEISVEGDRVLDKPLLELGGKGLFTREIEEALATGAIDLAVHSTKDMPTKLPAGLALTTFLTREDPRDVMISRDGTSLADLPDEALVGTASLRRRAQLLRLRPGLKVGTFRGNVQTRLRKLSEGQADATMLALAGLNRLGMADVATQVMSTQDFLPAPAQGAVCVEAREDDSHIGDILAPLHDAATTIEITAERAFLAALDGSCRTPIAALARQKDGQVHLTGRLLSLDGRQCFERSASAPAADAARLGRDMGLEIRAEAGQPFFDALFAAMAAAS